MFRHFRDSRQPCPRARIPQVSLWKPPCIRQFRKTSLTLQSSRGVVGTTLTTPLALARTQLRRSHSQLSSCSHRPWPWWRMSELYSQWCRHVQAGEYRSPRRSRRPVCGKPPTESGNVCTSTKARRSPNERAVRLCTARSWAHGRADLSKPRNRAEQVTMTIFRLRAGVAARGVCFGVRVRLL